MAWQYPGTMCDMCFFCSWIVHYVPRESFCQCSGEPCTVIPPKVQNVRMKSIWVVAKWHPLFSKGPVEPPDLLSSTGITSMTWVSGNAKPLTAAGINFHRIVGSHKLWHQTAPRYLIITAIFIIDHCSPLSTIDLPFLTLNNHHLPVIYQ